MLLNHDKCCQTCYLDSRLWDSDVLGELLPQCDVGVLLSSESRLQTAHCRLVEERATSSAPVAGRGRQGVEGRRVCDGKRAPGLTFTGKLCLHNYII